MAEAKEKTVAPDPRRALTLDQILGNEPIRRYLREAWRAGRLPQSLLLTGPAGVGKTTLAWALAREIVAEGGDPATHPRAGKIARGTHPDVLELSGKESVSMTIRVADIRSIEDRAMTSPLESPRKIILIEPADRMNDEAANGLLKILEEPPRHLLFILICAESNRLLDTIRSRCTVFQLEPVPTGELAEWLRRQDRLDEEKARLVALLAEGRPGYARSLAKAGVLAVRGEILEGLGFLVTHGFAGVFAAAQRFMETKAASLTERLTVAMTLMRDALVLRTRGEGILNVDLREKLEAFTHDRPLEGFLEAGRLFEQASAEAPWFYSAQAKAHFIECLMADVGKALR